jgi:uncharacterized RDD family membrane protein YckC
VTAVDPRPVPRAAGPVAPPTPAATEAVAAAEAAAEVLAAAEPVAPVVYVGLVTRALAFAVDAAIINAVALLVSVVVALALSILKVHDAWLAVSAVIGGVVYLTWTVSYFAAFWSTTGQTPGNRAMRIRVTANDGGGFGLRRALVRFAGLLLAALPLGAGFALILFDRRRRGLQDLLARTVVVDAPRRARG